MLEFKIMGSESQTFYSLKPFFDGSDYAQWKFKMELYLDCDSIKLWDIVHKGWELPKATVMVLKPLLREMIGVPFIKKAITKTKRL